MVYEFIKILMIVTLNLSPRLVQTDETKMILPRQTVNVLQQLTGAISVFN